MHLLKLFPLCALAALGLASVAPAATETVTVVERVPFDAEVFSECTART